MYNEAIKNMVVRECNIISCDCIQNHLPHSFLFQLQINEIYWNGLRNDQNAKISNWVSMHILLSRILGRELGPGGVSPNQRARWKHAFSPLKHV